MSQVKTLAAALQDVSNDDVEATASAAEAADDTPETTPETTEETPAKDEPSETEETEEEAEGESESEADNKGDEEDEDEDEDEDEEEASPLDELTPAQLAAIKANPETAKLYKSIMRAYTRKTQQNAQAIQLAEAFKKDPDRVLDAIARARGGEFKKGGEATQAPAVKQSQLEAAEVAIEKMFGKAGPEVRSALRNFMDAFVATKLEPVQGTLGQVIAAGEKGQMLNEEQQFKARHKTVLTPEIEAAVTELGNSGQIVPGDLSPREYLDTLLEVVLARRSQRSASKKLAERITRNKADAEPVRGVSAKSGAKKVSGIKPNMSLSNAFDLAAKELEEESA